MTSVGFGIQDLIFLLDIAAYISLFFLARGVIITDGIRSERPFLLTFILVTISSASFFAFPPLGIVAYLTSFLILYAYFILWAEEILGFFKGKSFLFTASIPFIGSFVGGMLIFLSVLLGSFPILPLITSLLGFYAILLSRGILLALTTWTVESAGLKRYWTFLLGLLGYVGLLIAVLIAKQRGRF